MYYLKLLSFSTIKFKLFFNLRSDSYFFTYQNHIGCSNAPIVMYNFGIQIIKYTQTNDDRKARSPHRAVGGYNVGSLFLRFSFQSLV